MITCGIDWAEAHHDMALADEQGHTVARCRTSADAAGLTAMLELIAEHGGDPATTPIAIETDKNLFVVALAAAGFTIHPINPKAVARYRERHTQSGGKSDPGDAIMLPTSCAPTTTSTGGCLRSANAQPREGAGGQTASRGDLGLAPSCQPAPVGAAGVLPASPQGVSHLKHHAATTVLAAALVSSSAKSDSTTRRHVAAPMRSPVRPRADREDHHHPAHRRAASAQPSRERLRSDRDRSDPRPGQAS